MADLPVHTLSVSACSLIFFYVCISIYLVYCMYYKACRASISSEARFIEYKIQIVELINHLLLQFIANLELILALSDACT